MLVFAGVRASRPLWCGSTGSLITTGSLASLSRTHQLLEARADYDRSFTTLTGICQTLEARERCSQSLTPRTRIRQPPEATRGCGRRKGRWWTGVRRLYNSSKLSCEGSTNPTTISSQPRTIFSGIQPTGVVHLGNYLGAVRQWVALQEGPDDLIYCVVDQHAITLQYDHLTLPQTIRATFASLLACGLDPERMILFQQSRVVEHSQLNWVLTCLSTMARLTHLPQYKEKRVGMKEIPLGLYVYPVLQAADILLYKATHVPVGEDQLPHIQLASHLARVFNNRYGQTFTLPAPLVMDTAAARVRSLRFPDKKMSKSEPNPKSRIDLTDTPDMIVEKFKKAMTDFTSAVYYDPETRPGVSNLMSIHSEVTGTSIQQITEGNSGLTTAQYKLVVAEAVIELLNPIRQRMDHLLSDPDHLTTLMEQGTERARERAVPTWQEVQRKVGLTV